MARVYKRTDRIPVRIDDVVVQLAPLSIDQKTEIQEAAVRGRAKGDIKELTRSITLAMKYAIKGVSGIEDSDGSPYKLEFDDSGYLTDECITDLTNVSIKDKLGAVCVKLMLGILTSDNLTDAAGKKLEGVELLNSVNDSGVSPKN